MLLGEQQVAKLAEIITETWNEGALTQLASDHLDVDLSALSLRTTFSERAHALITHFTTASPRGDRRLLQALRDHGNASVGALARQYLADEPFFSPTDQPYEAIVIRRSAFVDRRDLREELAAFANARPWTGVLVVSGTGTCGKSYTWELLRHVAAYANVTPIMLRCLDRFDQPRYSEPRELVEAVFRVLGLKPDDSLPSRIDDPQPARTVPDLVDAFVGHLPALPRPCWLVIDNLDHPALPSIVRETALELAKAVETHQPDRLWLALLGYDEAFGDGFDLNQVVRDDARFPSVEDLAEHLTHLAKAGGHPPEPDQARQWAAALVTKYPGETKAERMVLTRAIEDMGKKILSGDRP